MFDRQATHMIDDTETYHRFLERYEQASVPWDDPAPPPEIVALAQTLVPGWALDVGCGYGRAVIHLARQGWSAVGVDFVPQAIAEARRRAAAAGVAERAGFHVASATAMPFLQPPFDWVIDVGCMHSFTQEMLVSYRAELLRLQRPGSLYTLFVHLRDDAAEGNNGPRGIPEADIHDLLGDHYRLERAEYGVTQVEERPAWNSAWFWFRRTEGE